jgi:hypothetical protein
MRCTRKRGLVNYAEYMDLHASGVTALRLYFDEAAKTAAFLAKCTAAPLPLMERLGLMSQEIVENGAHAYYLGVKRRLHDAARLGYENSE